jgi:mobilization protein MobC
MPRRYKDDPRTYFKTFRFSAAEITRLETRAKARRQGLSAYVRATLFAKDDREDPGLAATSKPSGAAHPVSQRDRATSEEFPIGSSRRANAAVRVLIDQLRRVGTNLNQIAHRMNERRIALPRELTMTLDEIRALVRRAREL